MHLSRVPHVAGETAEQMASLWVVEERIRNQGPPARRIACREQSAAIVAELWPFRERELGRISGKSKLAAAIRYARSRRGVQETANKNAWLAGSEGGGKTWAMIATVLQTAKMNGVDPFAWLTQNLQRIAAS